MVCSKNSSLIEIGADAAFYCNPNSAVDIADKIKQIDSLSENQRNILASKLEDHAKIYSWQKVARETVAVYRKVFKY